MSYIFFQCKVTVSYPDLSLFSHWQNIEVIIILIFSTQIEDSCCDDSAGCLTEVINQWSCSGQPTWRELADHLSKIGEEQLSKDLMTIYGTSEYNQCIYCLIFLIGLLTHENSEN